MKDLAELKSLTAHLFCERSQGTFASLYISHPKGVCLAGAGWLSDNFGCMEGASYVMPKLQCARIMPGMCLPTHSRNHPLWACLALPPLRLLAQSSSPQRSSPKLCSASFCCRHCSIGWGIGDTSLSCFLLDPWYLILIVG